jgi:hypothetical protein
MVVLTEVRVLPEQQLHPNSALGAALATLARTPNFNFLLFLTVPPASPKWATPALSLMYH